MNLILIMLHDSNVKGRAGNVRDLENERLFDSLAKPKFHYATCDGEVADVDHETGMSRGSFWVSNHQDVPRWFREIP